MILEQVNTKIPKIYIIFYQPKKAIHPTQKSLELSEYIIKTYTNEGELVLDSTCGSGTIPCACINTNRNWIAFETDKKYFEFATKRIENQT